MLKKRKIPNATLDRLPLYFKFFKQSEENGVDRVSSREISEALDIDSATIRRDFSYFGELGRKGYGYNVRALVKFFSEQVQGNSIKNVILIGTGNLGSALLNYNFTKIHDKINIAVAFDIDEEIVGSTINGVEVIDISELESVIKEINAEIAILTVPGQVGVELSHDLESYGIKGILNFTPEKLAVSEKVTVHNIDLSVEMQALLFYMKHKY